MGSFSNIKARVLAALGLSAGAGFSRVIVECAYIKGGAIYIDKHSGPLLRYCAIRGTKVHFGPDAPADSLIQCVLRECEITHYREGQSTMKECVVLPKSDGWKESGNG